MTFQQVTWPEDLAQDLEQLDRLARGEIESYSLEKRYRTRQGEAVWALLAVSLVRNADGTPLYFIQQIEDINDLKKSREANKRLMAEITETNEALFQEKERLHITLDSIREAVISADSQQNIIFMNPVAEKISGWKQAEAQGKSLHEVLYITQGDQGPRLENLYSDENLDSDIELNKVLHSRYGGSFDIHHSMTRSVPRKASISVLCWSFRTSRNRAACCASSATAPATTRSPGCPIVPALKAS